MIGIAGTGGEGGIRTPDTGVSPYNGLANRRLQPLGHLSGDFQQFNMPPLVHRLGLIQRVRGIVKTHITVKKIRLLLWTRFRRHQARYTVVDGELAVVLSRVLDEPVCHVGNAGLLVAVGIG